MKPCKERRWHMKKERKKDSTHTTQQERYHNDEERKLNRAGGLDVRKTDDPENEEQLIDLWWLVCILWRRVNLKDCISILWQRLQVGDIDVLHRGLAGGTGRGTNFLNFILSKGMKWKTYLVTSGHNLENAGGRVWVPLGWAVFCTLNQLAQLEHRELASPEGLLCNAIDDGETAVWVFSDSLVFCLAPWRLVRPHDALEPRFSADVRLLFSWGGRRGIHSWWFGCCCWFVFGDLLLCSYSRAEEQRPKEQKQSKTINTLHNNRNTINFVNGNINYNF